ncbi:hypothetical protein [Bacillus suaedaesalsae]|uniref:LPXTG cell wall anchor domain-containing protein n=1 Tax=Bacillus suaedaesalsae TaxID=2810349 RepID=A0ABS2DE19_9BACI|nr:hypothetical protein [Bacillus suaedaesalsae]MBM6616275.1 hypothetical protein [Bacillus suaedaesalsae]
MPIGLIILGIIMVLLSFLTPVGVGNALVVSAILIVVGIFLYVKKKR